MTREELMNDVAYARSLAEEGRQAPLIGGPFLVLFGVLLAGAWSAHWAIVSGVIAAPHGALGLLWACFGVCAGIGAVFVSTSVRRKPGGAAIGNRADRAVWQAAAWAIASVVAGTILSMGVNGDAHAPDAIMPAAFGFYGIALLTTASLSGHRWLNGFGVAALASACVLWVLYGMAWTYLYGAAAALIVLLVPGIIMIRREPKALA